MKHIELFEAFKQKNIEIEDIVKCIESGGVIFTSIVEDLPTHDDIKKPLRPVSVDDLGVTVNIDGNLYNVDIEDILKIEY